MKHFSFIFLALAFMAFTLTQCKKDNDVSPQSPGTDTTIGGTKVSYNETDTSVTLQNGLITIDVPSGSMKEGTKISVGNSTVKFIDTAHVLHQFELKPSGTKFKKPVTLTFHYDSAWLKGNSPWNIGIAYKNDTDGKWYPAVNGNVDTVNNTISIKTTHFSHWTIYTCFHLYMKADGQFSEDYAQTIRMQPGDIGLLLLTMDEPPAWKTDPDKSKAFSNPLVAPLTTPPIDPKESYSKSMAPDEWDVNGRVNGDEHVGKILPVSGAQEKLYQYLAPPEPPENNPVSISATIHTLKHGDIILIQGVQILGKWKLEITDTTKVVSNAVKIYWATSDTVFFHLDKNNSLIADEASPGKTNFYHVWVSPPVTETISTTATMKVDKMTGKYNEKTNMLNSEILITAKGKTTTKMCVPAGCETLVQDGTLGYGGMIPKLKIALENRSGVTGSWDTTIIGDPGKLIYHYTFTLKAAKK